MIWGSIVLEFGGREKIQPMVRIVDAKDAEVDFDLLIGLLSLAIGLRMVGSREL